MSDTTLTDDTETLTRQIVQTYWPLLGIEDLADLTRPRPADLRWALAPSPDPLMRTLDCASIRAGNRRPWTAAPVARLLVSTVPPPNPDRGLPTPNRQRVPLGMSFPPKT